MSIDTRARILKSAKSEFAKKGFSGARMDAIAKKAKINNAMLYYYFGSKKKLYSEVFRSIFDEKHDNISILDIEDENLSCSQRLYCVLFFIVHQHMSEKDHEFNQIMAWEMAEGRKQLKPITRDFFIPRIEKVETIINEGIKEGVFQTENALLTVWSFISTVVFYVIQEETYQGSQLEKRLYRNIKADDMLHFLATQVFKSLATSLPVQIPEIPNEIQKSIIESIEKK